MARNDRAGTEGQAPTQGWFAVLGQPVHHSRSPWIHQAFAQQGGRGIDYRRIECAPGELARTLDTLRAQGLRGANITLPLKQEAFAYCTSPTPRAIAAQAVNTLHFPNQDVGPAVGDNTDGEGLVVDLQQRHGLRLRGARVLILGAGGAVRGILAPLLAAGVNEIALWNRSPDRVRALLNDVSDVRLQVCAQLGAETVASPFPLLINGTSAGHGQASSEEWERLALACSMAREGVYYDLSYGLAAQHALQLASACGCQAIDGLGMLVEQAALAFHRWFDRMPDTEAVYQQLRAS